MRTRVPTARQGIFAALALVSLAACGGAGKYGHARVYVPLDAEQEALHNAKSFDPVMFHRRPLEWRNRPVSLFGVVTRRVPGPGGTDDLTLSVRRLEPRNLCEYLTDESSCRVTVGDREYATVHALVALSGEDQVGEHSVGAGSLVRVVGQFGEAVDSGDGAPVMKVSYHRHWPRYYFVTKSSARTMKQ